MQCHVFHDQVKRGPQDSARAVSLQTWQNRQNSSQERHPIQSPSAKQCTNKTRNAEAIKKGTIAIPIRRSTLCNLVLTIYLSSRQSRSRIAPQRETRTPEPRPSTEAT
jgi:hypothetical protein